jgi:hypothetical protein
VDDLKVNAITRGDLARAILAIGHGNVPEPRRWKGPGQLGSDPRDSAEDIVPDQSGKGRTMVAQTNQGEPM